MHRVAIGGKNTDRLDDDDRRILEDDVKKDSMVVAWSVYQLAMRDDLLPRFAKADMPPKPPNTEETSSQPATPAVRTEAQQAKPRPKTTRRSHRNRGR